MFSSPRGKLLLPLLTALLLAACGPTPDVQAPAASSPVASAPPVSTPAPAPTPVSASGTVYEVRFANVGDGGGLRATARRVSGDAALSAQALSDVNGPLAMTPVATDTFVVNGKRHVKAVFKVTNNTGQALDHLTFVPINTDDTDGDASNNATTPTVGSTYFKDLKTYGATSADARATDLTPVSGQTLNVATGVPAADPNATPYAALNTSTLRPTAPSGLSVNGVAGSGWRADNLLSPGASANVTFAVDFPVASPQTDPFEFTVVVTVADDADTTALTAIHSIQGNGNTSPLAGQTVTTQGVVTADFEGTGQLSQLGGYFIQAPDAEADSDPATSEGVFVYCNTACPGVSVGDTVRLTGTVSEFAPTAANPSATVTEITGVTAFQKRGSSTPLPSAAAVSLPNTDWERYEGMRVRVQGTVTENYKLGRAGAVKVADARLPSYTVNNAPSTSGYAAWLAEIARRTIVIDDGSTGQNPASAFGRGNQPLSAANTLRTGDSADVTGVVHYGFDYTGTPDTYRIESTLADATFTAVNPRPAAPALGGNLSVASANVLNFFSTLVTSNSGCTPDGTNSANSRGANNCAEYQRQLDKVVGNLAGLNADVLGLMEVQNPATLPGNTLQLLVDALNARLGANTYTAVSNPNTGTDAITVAMLYKPARVRPVGTALNDTDPVNNRLPLAQVFQTPGGTKFAVVVNHLKSKGSPADSAQGNQDNADGQGASALRREQQIARLLDLIQNRIVVGLGVPNVISVGDYNAYPQEPSLVNFRKGLDGTSGTADDLIPVFPDSSYSYQFDAQFGSLDHAFVTQSMQALLAGGDGVGFQKWHDNADEPLALDYNLEFKSPAQQSSFYDATAYRSSDHDPLKVAFNVPVPTALSVSASGSDTPVPGQPYTLNISTTGSPDSATVSWGDGSSDTVTVSNNAASAVHSYAAAGNQTITVTVNRAADGGSASTTKAVTVTTPSLTLTTQSAASASVQAGQSASVTATFNIVNAAPVSYSTTVTPSGNAPAGGLTVSLNPTSSTANGSATVTATLGGVTAGSYTVTLTATGQYSTTASASLQRDRHGCSDRGRQAGHQ